MCNLIEFLFYIVIFFLVLPFSELLEPPYSGIVALSITAILYMCDLFRCFEKWLVNNNEPRVRDNILRKFLLLANAAAGIFIGRALGIILYEIASSPSPQFIFEFTSAATFGFVNIIKNKKTMPY